MDDCFLLRLLLECGCVIPSLTKNSLSGLPGLVNWFDSEALSRLLSCYRRAKAPSLITPLNEMRNLPLKTSVRLRPHCSFANFLRLTFRPRLGIGFANQAPPFAEKALKKEKTSTSTVQWKGFPSLRPHPDLPISLKKGEESIE